MKISLIIPCYNAIGKIEKCIESLREIEFPVNDFEVVFIDDCSKDNTFTYLQKICNTQKNWHAHQLANNSGSPSKPRNEGVKKATGKYVFFLDCDDEILPNALTELYDIAIKENSDIVRGELLAYDGTDSCLMNVISDFPHKGNVKEKIVAIIKNQSTTVCSLIKRYILLDNKIVWPEEIRMGEDTIFLINVLVASRVVSYKNSPDFIYHKELSSQERASTQTYGARELKNHLEVWAEAERLLSKIGLSYFEIRLQIALMSVIQQLTKFYTHDIDELLFLEFNKFVQASWRLIKTFKYSSRVNGVVEQIHKADYNGFLQEIKPNLLVAGYDLKFISPVYEYLKKDFNLKVDEWTGHNQHNDKQSKQLLDWAEVVFCEWMLGNAVWYSKHIRNDQKLFIRLHRFELTRPEFYKNVDFNKVNRVLAVSVYFFEKTIQYTKCPRHKMALIPNYLDVENYQKSDNPDKVYNLGIIGVLPSRKGYIKALQILKELKKYDSRYNLSVFGKMPKDLPWIKNDKAEMQYYNNCDQFIKENQLDSSVYVKGFVDVKKELKDIGFILSVSDKDELFESFHLAPADGFAAGNQGLLLDWNGVEYIYPKEYVFKSNEEIVQYVLSNNKFDLFNQNAELGINFIQEKYLLDGFINIFLKILDHSKPEISNSYNHELYDLKAWNKPIFNHSFDSFLALNDINNGIYHITLDYHLYLDILIDNIHKLEKNHMLFVFNGAVSNRETKKAPFFSGVELAKSLNVPLVAISDPMVSNISSLTTGWYLGNSSSNMYPDLARVISHISSKIGLKPILLGGSAGGFAALQIATILDGLAVFVMNPQTNLMKYNRNIIKNFIDNTCTLTKNEQDRCNINNDSYFDILIQKYKRANSLNYELLQTNKVVYLQNISDWHVNLHCKPFLEKYKIKQVKDSNIFINESNSIVSYLGDWGNGHIGPKPKYLCNILNQFMSGVSIEDINYRDLYNE